MTVHGYVLAGGRSTRMGFDKARAPVPGRWPMAVHVAGVLREAGLTPTLVRRGPADGLPWRWPDGGEVRVIREPDAGEPHPLWGVATALDDAARHEVRAALIVPCDAAALTPEDLAPLLDAGAPAVASLDSRPHPLVAHLPVAWAERARSLARDGAPARRLVEGALPIALWAAHLRNVNTWEDAGVPHPVDALLAGLPHLDAAARARVAAGERARLRARGVRVP